MLRAGSFAHHYFPRGRLPHRMLRAPSFGPDYFRTLRLLHRMRAPSFAHDYFRTGRLLHRRRRAAPFAQAHFRGGCRLRASIGLCLAHPQDGPVDFPRHAGRPATAAGANTIIPTAAIRARIADPPVGHAGCTNRRLSSRATTLHGSSWHSGASGHKPGSEDWFRYEPAQWASNSSGWAPRSMNSPSGVVVAGPGLACRVQRAQRVADPAFIRFV